MPSKGFNAGYDGDQFKFLFPSRILDFSYTTKGRQSEMVMLEDLFDLTRNGLYSLTSTDIQLNHGWHNMA